MAESERKIKPPNPQICILLLNGYNALKDYTSSG